MFLPVNFGKLSRAFSINSGGQGRPPLQLKLADYKLTLKIDLKF
jgi:hypothetical protein